MIDQVAQLLQDKKRSLIEVYLDIQQLSEEHYGEHAVVLMEVGSFWEVYGVDNAQTNIGKPKEIAQVLNLQLTRKNKSIAENSAANPLLAGFPTASFGRYVARLIEEGKYTIVLIKQRGNPPNVERYLERIISPGVHFDFTGANAQDMIAAITIERVGTVTNAGFAAVDIAGGTSVVQQIIGTKEDPNFALDELFRLIQSMQLNEVILTPIGEIDVHHTKEYLELLSHNGVHVRDREFPIAYQNQLLQDVFDVESMLSPIETLGLEQSPLVSLALTHLCEFVIEHDHDVLHRLQRPTHLHDSAYMYLGNQPLEQLDVLLPHGQADVLGLIDYTRTALGRRLLRQRIARPVKEPRIIEERYALVEQLTPLKQDVALLLRDMYDIERLSRRITVSRLHPFELNYVHDSLMTTQAILKLLDGGAHPAVQALLAQKEAIESMLRYLQKTFAFEKTTAAASNTIQTSFFAAGVDADLDGLLAKEQSTRAQLQTIADAVAEMIKKRTGKEESSFVQIRQLDKEGHYIHVTKSRFALIEDDIKEQFVSVNGTVHAFQDFRYKVQTGNVKITADVIDEISSAMITLQQKIIARTKQLYAREIQLLADRHVTLLQEVAALIAQIDVAASTAMAAEQLRLTKPTILAGDRALEIVDVRHILIEQHEEIGVYVPHTVALGANGQLGVQTAMRQEPEETRGVLLYGINASGKSSLMKSVGIAVLLAQAGYYVPATSMRFTPCDALFTRIIARDNLQRGLSSFGVEMMELKNIFVRATERSLVLADEISHGTETPSAIAIVGAAIDRLLEKQSLFFVTTHLHELMQYDILAEKNALRPMHLKVVFDEETKQLVFDRSLLPGSGEYVYGLEFAQTMHIDDAFLAKARTIRKRLLDKYSPLERLTHKKPSAYNSKLYLSACAVCDAPVEDTHHIRQQHTADQSGNINHFHKDHKYNLVPLCKGCHDKVHSGSLVIKGYIMTSSGMRLEYHEGV